MKKHIGWVSRYLLSYHLNTVLRTSNKLIRLSRSCFIPHVLSPIDVVIISVID